MTYTPRPVPTINNFEELRQYLDEELRFLALSLSESVAIDLRPVNAAPTRPRNGMIIYADGTDFDPGSGEGFYGYEGGAWVKL